MINLDLSACLHHVPALNVALVSLVTDHWSLWLWGRNTSPPQVHKGDSFIAFSPVVSSFCQHWFICFLTCRISQSIFAIKTTNDCKKCNWKCIGMLMSCICYQKFCRAFLDCITQINYIFFNLRKKEKPLGSIASMGKLAALVLLKLFININEACLNTEAPITWAEPYFQM